MLGLLRGPAPWLLGGELACPDHCRSLAGTIRARRACKCPAALPVLTLERGAPEIGGEVAGGLVIEERSAGPLGFAQEPARMQEFSSDSLPKTLGQVWCDCAAAEVRIRDIASYIIWKVKALGLQLPGLENLSEPQDDEGCAVPQCSAAGIQVRRHRRQPLVAYTGSYSACRQRSSACLLTGCTRHLWAWQTYQVSAYD